MGDDDESAVLVKHATATHAAALYPCTATRAGAEIVLAAVDVAAEPEPGDELQLAGVTLAIIAVEAVPLGFACRCVPAIGNSVARTQDM